MGERPSPPPCRVVDRVHDRAADRRADAEVAGLAGLAELDVLMLEVADLTDGGLAVETHEPDLARGEADLRHAVFLGHKLRGGAGGANKLRAAAGIKLDGVDERTHGDRADGQHVAGFDVGVLARHTAYRRPTAVGSQGYSSFCRYRPQAGRYRRCGWDRTRSATTLFVASEFRLKSMILYFWRLPPP